MKRALVGLVLALGLASVPGCGSDDSGSSGAVGDCKKFVSAVCSKFFGCFSNAELSAFADFIGNNEADCRTKLGTECTSEKVKCDSGLSYDPAAGKECLSQFNALSCDEFGSDTTAQPAACDQTCK